MTKVKRSGGEGNGAESELGQRRCGGMYFWVRSTELGGVGMDGAEFEMGGAGFGIECPLTSTPPLEKRRPGAVVG